VGFLLFTLAMAWGFALHLASWVELPVERLEGLAAVSSTAASLEEWEPVGWSLDRIAARLRALILQNRRGQEALREVEAVRDEAGRLLRQWEGMDVEGPVAQEDPREFWGHVRRVLVERLGDLSRRAEALAERIRGAKERSAAMTQALLEMTIRSESLFLEASKEAIRQERGNEIVEEVRQGLEAWRRKASPALAEESLKELQAWEDWILHCLREAGVQPGPGDAGLERLSRDLESLGREAETMTQELEGCHVLAMEVRAALPVPEEEGEDAGETA
jgi:hypothetical protein